jgi:uncharacterized protein
MMHTETVARAQPANPSFDCRRARDLDERAICSDGRLAELDQAVAIAYAQASKDPKFKQEARETAKETLAARHSCGDNRICILDQQVRAIDSYSGLGSKVPVPLWVGRYRIDLFESGSELPTKNLPGRIGQCTATKIASISTRFGEELKPPADEFESSGRPYPLLMEVIRSPTVTFQQLLTLTSETKCFFASSRFPKSARPAMTEGSFIRRRT